MNLAVIVESRESPFGSRTGQDVGYLTIAVIIPDKVMRRWLLTHWLNAFGLVTWVVTRLKASSEETGVRRR